MPQCLPFVLVYVCSFVGAIKRAQLEFFPIFFFVPVDFFMFIFIFILLWLGFTPFGSFFFRVPTWLRGVLVCNWICSISYALIASVSVY